jgi:hypothetical protein
MVESARFWHLETEDMELLQEDIMALFGILQK